MRKRWVVVVVLLLGAGCVGAPEEIESDSFAAKKTEGKGKLGDACGGPDDKDCKHDLFCQSSSPGVCPGDPAFDGVCAARPGTCPVVDDPVCGCDGVTYANACEAAAAGENVDTPGECSPFCAPGSTAPCYDGPPGTEGVGTCAAGVQICNSSGTGFGACVGSVTPVAEVCGDGLDNDCDGIVDQAPPCAGFLCGDGVCAPFVEDNCNCPIDCPPTCGNGVCDCEETCFTCPSECGECPPFCADGVCSPEEDGCSCPDDCGPCSP